MKKAKLIFGLLALTIFSLSFVSNYSTVDDGNDTEQAIKKNKTKGIPSGG